MKPCRLWTGAKNPDGYGMRRVKAGDKWVARGVHRLACIEAHGPPPPGKPEAMHTCDNPACYEPSHLRWGSRHDNMGDAARKGRMRRGETHPRVRLTADKVRAIRCSDETQATLAVRYGVSPQQIARIQSFEQWRHVQ